MLILVAVTILVAICFCVAAMGISSAVDSVYKNKDKNPNRYECGFANFEDIRFFDNKLSFVPPFIVIEMMAIWTLFCVTMSVCFDVHVQYVCFLLFSVVFVVCLFHSQKKITIQ
jgi:NADH:ubiquinone oxidoreductase subunit 3 (subunit A)